jgi:hypothetical protein
MIYNKEILKKILKESLINEGIVNGDNMPESPIEYSPEDEKMIFDAIEFIKKYSAWDFIDLLCKKFESNIGSNSEYKQLGWLKSCLKDY